jgi:hypothetical protein
VPVLETVAEVNLASAKRLVAAGVEVFGLGTWGLDPGRAMPAPGMPSGFPAACCDIVSWGTTLLAKVQPHPPPRAQRSAL